MGWIGFALVVVLLAVIVGAVFRSHRPTRRSRPQGASLPPPPSDAKQSTGSAYDEAAVSKAAPAPAPKPSPRAEASPADADVPSLFVPDAEEPLTIVTQRFQPQSLQAYLDGTEASDGDSLPFGFILVSAVGRTDIGRRRKHNEDSYLVLPDEHLFVVADGMGGHAAGEVASAIAVETLLHTFRSKQFPGKPVADRPRRADELVRSIEAANRAIFEQAKANPEQDGMGTTIVAARFAPTRQRVYIAHAGDSRCYRLRDGEFTMLTRDHTMAAWGVGGREGEKLTRALGVAHDIEVDVTEDAPIARDQYLICSDGLTKMLPDDEISRILGSHAEPEDTVRGLIEAANERGGRDNVTAIVIQVHETASI
jgi:protein phosphatase